MADEAGAATRTGLAAERTWLAWWRTALAATAGALAVGRFAPELLNVPSWPYAVLGAGYAALALALLSWAHTASGTSSAHRPRRAGSAPVRRGRRLHGRRASLTLMTFVLVVAQT